MKCSTGTGSARNRLWACTKPAEFGFRDVVQPRQGQVRLEAPPLRLKAAALQRSLDLALQPLERLACAPRQSTATGCARPC